MLVVLVMVWSSPATADTITFQCSWENNAPITITVDVKTMKASRDDGGKDYTVIKLTKYAVWLLVDEPDNVAGAALHMIQRAEATQPNPSLTVARYKFLRDFISNPYKSTSMYLGSLFYLFVYVDFFCIYL
jgi:hypothetical protein